MLVRTFSAAWIAVCLAVGSAAPVLAQEKVHTIVSTEQMEQLLKGFGPEFKKSAPRNLEGHFFYDFNLGKRSMRLYFNKGTNIMLDTLFPDQPLETLNRWNASKARVTRATFHKDAKNSYTSLEANLNFAGGVTDGTIRQFINDFKDEAVAFDLFVAGKDAPPPIIGPEGDKIAKLSPDLVEKIFAGLRLNAKKQSPRAEVLNYDYESAKNYKIRLTNFGNQELMLDAVFKKMPLEMLNRYNFNRKFIRAVYLTQGNVEYTALEANLDCAAGISENMIRHYMVTFDEEVQTFIEFINKN